MKRSFGLTHGLLYAFIVVIVLMTSIGLARAAPNSGVVGTGTSGSCTEAAFSTALSGGGTMTFNCGGPKTITLTSAAHRGRMPATSAPWNLAACCRESMYRC